MIQGNVVSMTRTVFAVAEKAMQMSPGGMEVQDDSDDEVHTVMCSVRGEEKSAPMVCELEVQGELVEFETDRGSPFTIMGNVQ